jgi:acetyl-CoA acetyltransferase
VVKFDEQPFKAKLDKIPGLKPAFKKDGTITAANASSISDGAAALVLMREAPPRRWASRPSRASSAMRCTRRRPPGLPPRRPAPSARC